MINTSAVELIKEFESLELKAYQCPAQIGTDKYSIGYGHTSDSYFKVAKGMVIDEAKALDLLLHDIEEAEDTLKIHYPDYHKLNANQYGALVSLVYNIKGGLKIYSKEKKRFTDRTILLKLKKGDMQGAADSFMLYVKGGGKILPGLVRRRKAERELFLKPYDGN